VNLGVVLVGSWIAVPRMGAIGAAWVLVAGNVVTALLFGFLVIRCVRRVPSPAG
jgi:O-antigen/teichoic acid export membrane protein